MKMIANKKLMKFLIFKNPSIKAFSGSGIDYSYDTTNFLSKVASYESSLNNVIHEYTAIESPVEGYANEKGTNYYSSRNQENIHSENFKKTYDDLTISSIGIGTYMGKPDDIDDFYIYNAIKSAVLSGAINMIDTSINYRYMKSERAVGKALQMLIHKYRIKREEIILSSKIGFVPEDADSGLRCHSFVSDLIEKEQMDINDVIYDELKRPVHCIHPSFLETQLNISLKNLNVKTLDILYLHNVVESQSCLPKQLLKDRMARAFEFCEKKRVEGKIRKYGLATWNSFRVDSTNAQHCNLQETIECVKSVAGNDNGFAYIQVPVNIMNPEAFIEKFQTYKSEDISGKAESSKETETKNSTATLTAVCARSKINVITSSPLLQGILTELPLENKIFKVKSNVAKHLQFIRSIPAEAIKSTLVGMKNQVHLHNNLEVSRVPRLSSKEFYEVLAPKKRAPYIEKEVV